MKKKMPSFLKKMDGLVIDLKVKLKDKKNKILLPLAKKLSKIGIIANIVTFFSWLTGLISVYYLFQNHLLFLTLLIVSTLLDILDGSMAKFEQKSENTWYLDQLSDRTVTLALLLKTVLNTQINSYLSVAVLVIYLLATALLFYVKFKNPKQKFLVNIPALYLPYLFKFYELGLILFIPSQIMMIWKFGLKKLFLSSKN